MVEEAAAVLRVLDGVRKVAVQDLGLLDAHDPAGGVVHPQIALFGVEDRHGHRRLLERQLSQVAAPPVRRRGDHVSGRGPFQALERVRPQGQLRAAPVLTPYGHHTVAAVRPQRPPGLARVPFQQVRHRSAGDVRRGVPGQQLRALAPAGHDSVRVNHHHGVTGRGCPPSIARDFHHMYKDDVIRQSHQPGSGPESGPGRVAQQSQGVLRCHGLLSGGCSSASSATTVTSDGGGAGLPGRRASCFQERGPRVPTEPRRHGRRPRTASPEDSPRTAAETPYSARSPRRTPRRRPDR